MDDALAASERAVEVARAVGEPALQAHADAIHGYALIGTGRLEEGWQILEAAWEAADAANDMQVAYLTTMWLGFAALTLGDPEEGQRYIERELEKPRLAQAPDPRLTLQGLLGYCLSFGGELERGLALVQEADAVIKGGFDLAPELWAGNWEHSEATSRQTRDHYRRQGDRWLTAEMSYRLARTLRLKGEDSAAVLLLHENVDVAVEGGCPFQELRCHADLALLATDTGDSESADAHLARCHEIMAGGEDWRGLTGRVLLAQGMHAAAQGRVSEAEDTLQEAAALFRRFGLPWDEAEARQRLGRALLKAEERVRALEQFDAALAIYRHHKAGAVWVQRVMEDRVAAGGLITS